MAEDFFAILNFARRPWLDAEEVRARFQALSATQHPDAGGSAEQFSRLNEAARVLAEPSLRVKHLLELEIGPVARGAVLDAEMQQLFMEVGAVLQAVRQWREKEQQARSPLTKALLAPEKRALSERVTATLDKAERCEAGLLAQLKASVNWSQQTEKLAALGERLTFCMKWLKQLREVQFALG